MYLNKTGLVRVLVLAITLVWLAGCTERPATTSPEAVSTSSKFTMVTSFYPMYIMALNIADNIPGVEVINLASPQTGCLHDYQLSPENLLTLEKADVLIVNGAGMESFLDKVVEQQPDLKVIEASEGIPLIKNSTTQEDNPHVWVSVHYAIQEVKNITRQLSLADPEHSQKYQSNASKYIKKLEILAEKMHRELAGVSNRNIVTFHEAFPYFAREYNLNIVAVVEREPGSEPSASELAEIVDTVKRSKAQAIFAEPQYSSGAAETIARETGIKVYYLDPAVSGPDSPDAYIKIMETNLATLKGALK
ncbi:MAG: metal ABC transporter substrate-binding protein [Syntrophomonadaceae bacterium]